MKTHLNCPCGEAITGKDEDDLVEKAQEHLSQVHPGRDYDRDAILFMAYWLIVAANLYTVGGLDHPVIANTTAGNDV